MIGEVKTPLSLVSSIQHIVEATIQDYYEAQGFSRSTSVVCTVNGDPVLRKDWGRVLVPEDRIFFFIVPAGRTFKAILSIVATIAAFAALYFLTPLSLAAAGAIASAIGAVFNVLLTPRVPNATAAAASPTYSTEAQGNQARLLNPIPRGYGLHNIVPDFASQPYTTFENNDQYLYQLFCLGVGEYDVHSLRIGTTEVWNVVTGYSASFEDVTVEVVPPGSPVTLFPSAVQVSSLVGGADMLSGVTLGPFPVNTPTTQINKISYDFTFNAGLFGTDKKTGGLTNKTVVAHIEYRLIDNTGAPAGPWVVIGTPSWTLATATAQRFTQSFDVPLGRYEARVTRITADNTDSSAQDKIQWVGLRGFQPSSEVHNDVTLMAVKIKATNQLSQQASRQFNVIQISKLPIWDGATWSAPTATQSIAWIVADMLRNAVYGEGRPDNLIDLDKLLQLDATWATRGDTFNGVFDTKRTFWESLGLVLAAGRAQPMLVAGVCTFMRDEPRALPKGVFSPGNIVKDSFATQHLLYDDGTADDVIVEFQDERTWTQNEVQCTIPGSESANPARISLFGITNREQAWREGMYQAACNLYRRVTASLTSEMEGKLLVRGDVAQVSHDMNKWGGSGKIVAYDAPSRTLYLSDPMTWTDGPFSIALADKHGRYWGPVTVERGLDDSIAVINAVSLQAVEASQSPISTVVVTDPNKISTRFLFGTTTTISKRFILVSTKPRSIDKVEIALINDDPRVYIVDTGNPPLEDLPAGPGIDPNAPIITGLHVHLNPSTNTSAALISASWDASPGANNYVAQTSVDGISWETVYEGTNASTSFAAPAGVISFRVAAIGLVRGPWVVAVKNYSNPLLSPAQVQHINISVSNGQSLIQADWADSALATSYIVEIIPLTDAEASGNGGGSYVPNSFGNNTVTDYQIGSIPTAIP